ncbi:HNH endonuclease signature motif containing protein [Novosphingobium sp.]|uniref:HNH endonuclease n=1 Tax=Novosphingobium sp. TaxID=1874826 RepID=UPI00286D90DE|nr:HNH endonuclease signature motif containing protein [Novosphingobium sp.]
MSLAVKRRKARNRRRELIRLAQANRCALCGERLGSTKPTFEHVQPRARGGRSHRNIVLTHENCNQRRADAPPTGCLLIMLEVVNAMVPA